MRLIFFFKRTCDEFFFFFKFQAVAIDDDDDDGKSLQEKGSNVVQCTMIFYWTIQHCLFYFIYLFITSRPSALYPSSFFFMLKEKSIWILIEKSYMKITLVTIASWANCYHWPHFFLHIFFCMNFIHKDKHLVHITFS